MRYVILILLAIGIVCSSISVTRAAEPAKCPSGGPQGLIDPTCDLKQNLEHIYPIAVRIIVLLAFLAVIYAGYVYITSFGQPARIEEAKSWVIAAVTGLALILLVPVIISALDAIKAQLPGS